MPSEAPCAAARPVKAGRAGGAVVLFIDLDHFKRSTTRSATPWATLLMEVAPRLRQRVPRARHRRRARRRRVRRRARPTSRADAAALVARRSSSAWRAPFDLGGHEVYVSASIGIAIFPTDGEDADALLERRHRDVPREGAAAATLPVLHRRDERRGRTARCSSTRRCAARSSARSSACTTSRSRPATRGSSRPRRCCAGSIRARPGPAGRLHAGAEETGLIVADRRVGAAARLRGRPRWRKRRAPGCRCR